MASSEDIEARLCAYIEGDLDPAQQAEIERHLAAHPQHRKMIDDLIRTRALLGALPRASAPSELGEGVQGQLERAMLLGDSNGNSIIHDPWQQHIRRVPHLFVVAAVMFLAVGLGSVVYYLLHAAARPAGVYGTIAVVPAAQPDESQSPAQSVSIAQTAITTPPSVVMAPQAPATMPVDDDEAIQASMVGAPSGPATQPVLVVPDTQPSPFSAAADISAPATQPSDDAMNLPLLDRLTDPSTQPALQAIAVPDVQQPAIQPPATQPVAADGDGK